MAQGLLHSCHAAAASGWANGPKVRKKFLNRDNTGTHDMKKRQSGFAALGLAIASLAVLHPAMAQDRFEGVYGAVEGGMGYIKREGTTFLGPIDETDNSAIIGGALGVRSNFGDNTDLVLGLEAGGDLYTDGSQWRYGISGIGGWKVRDDDLAYVRVGYGSFSDDVDLDGMVLGAGYELALNNRFSLRFDYRSLFYGDTNFVDNSIDNHGHEITTALVFRPWAGNN